MCSVGGGLGWLDLDATHAVSLGDGDTDVTRFTPVGSPRVLDLVVRSAVGVNTVAHCKDSVVEIGTAVSCNDTTCVSLENFLVGLDSNRDGSLSDGGLEGVRVLRSHINEALGGNLALAGVVAAALRGGPALVGVVSFSLESVGLGPGEGAVHHASHAAQVAVVGAVDQVLLGQGQELASCDKVSTLHRASGRERPARTAGALVLNFGHGTLGNPVNLGHLRGGESSVLLTLIQRFKSEEAHSCVEFIVGPVGELVVAHLGSGAVSVVLQDLGSGLLEEVFADLELLLGSVALVVLGDVLDKVVVGGLHHGGACHASQCQSKNLSHFNLSLFSCLIVIRMH